MVCKDIKELEKELQDRIDAALLTDVAEMVRDVMTDHINRDVYDVYEPSQYTRRYNESGIDINSRFDDTNNTGLLDPANITAYIDRTGILTVENDTVGSKYYYKKGSKVISKNAGKPIAGVIETGNGYDVWDDAEPRPFIANTRDEIREGDYHIKALKQALKRMGLDVK